MPLFFLGGNLTKQPGARKCPIVFGGGRRNSQSFSNLLVSHAGKISELYRLCLAWMFLSKLLHSFIKNQKLVIAFRAYQQILFHFNSNISAPVTHSLAT